MGFNYSPANVPGNAWRRIITTLHYLVGGKRQNHYNRYKTAAVTLRGVVMTGMNIVLQLLDVQQLEIAEEAGKSAAYISQIVNGDRRATTEIIAVFAAKTGLSIKRVRELLPECEQVSEVMSK